MVDSSAFQCGVHYKNIGTSRASIVASDFRFYVHDVRLITAKGDTVRAALRPESPWADGDVALLDFENGTASCANGTPQTRDSLVVMAPAGDYRGVAFALGVPFSRNHEDLTKAPPPLSLSALAWSWMAGRKFMRVDMRATVADSAPTPWVIHLGSTGCRSADSTAKSPTVCTHPNRATIVLTAFDPKRDVVVADLAAILSRVDVRKNQPKTASGCMSADSDSDCGGLFASLG
ncbi:MAG: MbnP family copper-binding protein, partial [Gemmatimonas sp.]